MERGSTFLSSSLSHWWRPRPTLAYSLQSSRPDSGRLVCVTRSGSTGPSDRGSTSTRTEPLNRGSGPSKIGPFGWGSGPPKTGPFEWGSGPSKSEPSGRGSGPLKTGPFDLGSGPSKSGPSGWGSGPLETGPFDRGSSISMHDILENQTMHFNSENSSHVKLEMVAFLDRLIISKHSKPDNHVTSSVFLAISSTSFFNHSWLSSLTGVPWLEIGLCHVMNRMQDSYKHS